jgi:hypothetical protein
MKVNRHLYFAMKYYFTVIIFIAVFSCSSKKNSKEFGKFPLEVPEQNSLMAQWEKKPVLDSRLIDDMELDSVWKVTGIGEMSYTHDRAKDGKRSLRFRTSLRDTSLYPRYRSQWNSFNGISGGSSGVILNFNTPQDWSAFNRLSFWVYVHPTSMLTYAINLGIGNKGTVYTATTPRGEPHYIQDLKPGQWNHILYEIPHLDRDKVIQFKLQQNLRGHNPEEEGIVTYDFDKIELQLVEPDQFEGWSVAPGKFAFSHIGYRPKDPKIAMVGSGNDRSFQLVDQNNNVVFSGNIQVIENKNGLFRQLNFSDFRKEGIYRFRCGTLESNPFPINENIWLQPVYKAINFYFCERCGYFVPGIHRECHNDWQGFHGDKKKIINGGWHDAGDLSQGFWRTAMAVFAMMQNLESLQNRPDIEKIEERIRSEIVWGLEWLLKTRFGDGFHMTWSMMRIYTDNKVGTVDDVISPAQNVPWENFLAAAVECKAAMMLEKSYPELTGKARIAAIEDWKAAVASQTKWEKASYQEAAWGVTSSLLLGRLTGENKYKEEAIRFGNMLVRCQEQNFIDGIPITGYFYTDTDRKRVIHNFHFAFEEAPMIALAMLCNEFPEHEKWIDWYSAAAIYSDFFLKRGSQIASPYDLFPNSVYKKQEIMAEKDEKLREEMLHQFNDGTRLNEEYVLRTFPIYFNSAFHGNTNIQLSGSWALAEASRLRNDSMGMQLVGKQLQWVFGANPFGQSLMYGVGYDFAPQFAGCLKDVVGSLPVGMDCMSGDKPFWGASNYATHKEIWMEPVNRFLGAVSIYASQDQFISAKQEPGKDIQIQAETIQPDKGNATVILIINGRGIHEIEIKVFNAKTNFNKRQIELSGNKTEKIELELNAADRNKPYVAVICVDKNPDFRKEIVGSYNNASVIAKK